MKALLLLAGRSRRFWPLTEKSLFPICGKTLVEHQVETLQKGGCKEIILVVGAHNKKEVRKMFPTLTIVEQKDLDLGMQGACLSALPKILGGAQNSAPVLIVSGNDVIDPEALISLRKEAAKPKTGGAILARKVKTYFPGGYLTVKSGKITGIVEKPGAGKEPSKFVNIVAHIHNDPRALLAALKSVKNHRDDGYEQALHALFAVSTYRAVPYEGFWQPVKYPSHLLLLLDHFLSHIKKPSIHSSVKVHPSAVIEGNVVIGEGTRVLPHATIVGPCTVGRDCIIGNNALVRHASIGDGCVVGYNSEVKSSILAGPVWTHITYLGDSIIGRNVSFGGGCVTGNLRLDESDIEEGIKKLGIVVGDDCRFGIHIGSNPGVKVGPGSFIAGGVFLKDDVPEKSFVTVKDGITHVRPNKAGAPKMANRKR
ncbi:hypothetical protein EXS70_04830 [Candidatus Peribacteria bacterium]|nr:hypothetical protein [Candidatus Peribacteria bacterium]